jgi:hypothetical protein
MAFQVEFRPDYKFNVEAFNSHSDVSKGVAIVTYDECDFIYSEECSLPTDEDAVVANAKAAKAEYDSRGSSLKTIESNLRTKLRAE